MDHQPRCQHYRFDFSCPGCCWGKVQENPASFASMMTYGPDGFAELAETHGPLLERQLLRAAAAAPSVGRHGMQTPDLVRWMSRVDAPERIIRALPIVGAVAAGIAQARCKMNSTESRAEKELVAEIAAHVDKHAVALWCDITLLAATSDSLSQAGLRMQVEKHATKRPAVWARSLEWLLVMGSALHGVDAALTMSLAEHPSVRAALARSTRSEVLKVQQRATGIQAVMRGEGPWEAWLLEELSSTLDARRTIFPRPLGAPSSTWLASHDLEEQIRDTAAHALRAFGDYVHDCGGLEEESLTATLLQNLVQSCAEMTRTSRWAAPRGLPQVEMASRQVAKKEEATTGADVGIVVDINATGRLKTRIGDLVQIKKAHALVPSKKSRRDTWTIDLDQLGKLLRHSTTAVYWLILGDANILVVPAKYLAAISAANPRKSGNLTVKRSDLRHAAVPLANYLTDLMLGLWLGSNDKAALDAAEGRTPAVRPRHVLGITVTVPRVLDEAPDRSTEFY